MEVLLPFGLLLTGIVWYSLKKNGRQWPFGLACLLLGRLLPPGLARMADSLSLTLQDLANQAAQAAVDGWNQVWQ